METARGVPNGTNLSGADAPVTNKEKNLSEKSNCDRLRLTRWGLNEPGVSKEERYWGPCNWPLSVKVITLKNASDNATTK